MVTCPVSVNEHSAGDMSLVMSGTGVVCVCAVVETAGMKCGGDQLCGAETEDDRVNGTQTAAGFRDREARHGGGQQDDNIRCPDVEQESGDAASGSEQCGDPGHSDAGGVGSHSDKLNSVSPGPADCRPDTAGGLDDGVRCLDSGWVVDEPAQLLRLYGAGSPTAPPLTPDSRLWRVVTPYLMDQQAAGIARQMETGQVPGRRRRRRPPPPPPPDPVTTAGVGLMAAAAPARTAAGPSPAEYRQNNATARRAARRLLERSEPPLSGPRHGANLSGTPQLLTGEGGDQYVLPAHSRFLCADVTGAFDDVSVVSQLTEDGPRFDCVLLDPPWSNKFVRRKRNREGYQSLEAASLASLPVDQLTADGALVAVWCTNSSGHGHTLRHTLLPAWGVQPIAEWHWVKVTQYGQPVTPAGHHSKRPYEVLVLGRRGPPPAGLPAPPPGRLLVSVPCAVHSRKPLLHELLRPYLPAGYRGLEVFARGLMPGWTAWGDQPLLLQRLGALLLTEQQAEERQRAEEQERAEEDEDEEDRTERQQMSEEQEQGTGEQKQLVQDQQRLGAAERPEPRTEEAGR